MIQRIQTVFLLLANVAVVLMFFLSIALFQGETVYCRFYIYGAKDLLPDPQHPLTTLAALPMVIMALLMLALVSVAIFKYKNRPSQLKLLSSAILLNTLLIAVLLLYYIPELEKKLSCVPYYFDQYGIFLPLVSLACLFLARWGINRDEKLVRSADRLRN